MSIFNSHLIHQHIFNKYKTICVHDTPQRTTPSPPQCWTGTWYHLWATFWPSTGINTDVNRYIPERTTTKVVMIPHLNPKFQGLNIWVFHLFVAQSPLFNSILDFNWHLINYNIFSLKYDEILACTWAGVHPYILVNYNLDKNLTRVLENRKGFINLYRRYWQFPWETYWQFFVAFLPHTKGNS